MTETASPVTPLPSPIQIDPLEFIEETIKDLMAQGFPSVPSSYDETTEDTHGRVLDQPQQ